MNRLPIVLHRSSSKLFAAAIGLCLAVGHLTLAGELVFDFNFPDGTTNLGGGTVLVDNGNFTPSVQGGRLQLTSADTKRSESAFHIPAQPDSIKGFEVWFDYELSDPAGGNEPADGFSFSYGAIPFGGNTTHAEEGWPGVSNVLSFEIDPFFIGGPEVGPAIGLNRPADIGGAGLSLDASSLAHTNGPILLDGETISGTVHIRLTSAGIADYSTTGALTNAAFAGIDAGAAGFTLDNSYSFALAARTGGFTENVFIDNLRIVWIPEPSSLVLAGIGIPLLWRRKRR